MPYSDHTVTDRLLIYNALRGKTDLNAGALIDLLLQNLSLHVPHDPYMNGMMHFIHIYA